MLYCKKLLIDLEQTPMNSADMRNCLAGSFSIRVLLVFCALFSFFSCIRGIPHDEVQPPEVDYLTASWYGPEFHGRPTASGESFDMYKMTCAHRGFPFGTKLRITNLRNNKSTIVTVNDRGPYVFGRDLDLSYAAAREIGLINPGIGRVKIQYAGRDMRYVKRLSLTISPETTTGPYTIQVGSFRDEYNAYRLKQGLEIKYKGVYLTTTSVNGKKLYRVRIGSFKDKDRAIKFANALAEEGYGIYITNRDN